MNLWLLLYLAGYTITIPIAGRWQRQAIHERGRTYIPANSIVTHTRWHPVSVALFAPLFWPALLLFYIGVVLAKVKVGLALRYLLTGAKFNERF